MEKQNQTAKLLEQTDWPKQSQGTGSSTRESNCEDLANDINKQQD